MTRYTTKTKLYVEDEVWWEDSPMLPSLTVDSAESVDTGLISLQGEAIYRLPNPIGFGRDEEW